MRYTHWKVYSIHLAETSPPNSLYKEKKLKWVQQFVTNQLLNSQNKPGAADQKYKYLLCKLRAELKLRRNWMSLSPFQLGISVSKNFFHENDTQEKQYMEWFYFVLVLSSVEMEWFYFVLVLSSVGIQKMQICDSFKTLSGQNSPR